MTEKDILHSINIALTDEHLHDINMGKADVYHDEDNGTINVALGLDRAPFTDRFLVRVERVEAVDEDTDRWLTGRWIQTISGGRFDLDAPHPDQVNVEDIAHALSLLNRYTGHTSQPYTVAAHTLLVADILATEGWDATTVYAGLLHDAAEAYVGDLSRPLRRLVPGYNRIEERVSKAVYTALGLDVDAVDWDGVAWADNVALFVERRDLLGESPDEWDEDDQEWTTAAEDCRVGYAYVDYARLKGVWLKRYRELRAKAEEAVAA